MPDIVHIELSRRSLLSALGATAALSSVRVFAAAQDKIIVSGASGQLGQLIIGELLKRGVSASNLILVTRTPEQLAQYSKRGASVRFGDLNQPESLAAAYAGGTRMIMVSIGGRYDTPRPLLHGNGFVAAVNAGVKHIAFTSIIVAGSPDSPLGADYQQSEERVKASGAQWTLLRNGQYFEFSVLPQAIAMAKSGLAGIPFNEAKSAPITRADCAAAAASVILSSKYMNKTLDITGPELVGVEDIANATSNITGKRISISRETMPATADSTTTGGTLSSHPNTELQQVLGHPATGLRNFLLMHKNELLT